MRAIPNCQLEARHVRGFLVSVSFSVAGALSLLAVDRPRLLIRLRRTGPPGPPEYLQRQLDRIVAGCACG